jgi:aryl-alcohol dehydrogenase-like predicted oxidoreductase
MRTTRLGRTGQAAAAIAFGAWQLESAAIEAVRSTVAGLSRESV